MALIERQRQLDELQDALAEAARGRGRLVLVGGEAGGGKTALLEAFCRRLGNDCRVLRGACDGVITPRPLGPVHDLAAQAGRPLADALGAGSTRYELLAALLDELESAAPTVVVLEDLHWADEATLDLLRLVARRLAGTGALVVGTYRDDEVGARHPLRVVLGDIATFETVSRMSLPPLSEAGVRALAGDADVDVAELYRQTGGNPFFVTEVLAAQEPGVPATVRDAVLARAARLSPAARRVLDAASVIGARVELDLLGALEQAPDGLEACVERGVLRADGSDVAFRHELARIAIEEALAPDRRVELHRRLLAVLSAGRWRDDHARLAHHAESAGDAEAVLEHAPAAADAAARFGAQREAAAEYGRALRFAAACPPEQLADLLERRSYACYVTGCFDDAIEAQERALDLRRRLADRLREGEALRALSQLYRFQGRTREALAAARESLGLLEELPPGHELALAYNNLAHICVTADDYAGTLRWAERARDLAEQLGDADAVVYAMTSAGAAEFLSGRIEGAEKLERALELALAAGLEEYAGRAYLNLVWWPLRQRAYALADRYLGPGLDYCAERGLELWRLFGDGEVRDRPRESEGGRLPDHHADDPEHGLPLPEPDGRGLRRDQAGDPRLREGRRVVAARGARVGVHGEAEDAAAARRHVWRLRGGLPLRGRQLRLPRRPGHVPEDESADRVCLRLLAPEPGDAALLGLVPEPERRLLRAQPARPSLQRGLRRRSSRGPVARPALGAVAAEAYPDVEPLSADRSPPSASR